jgi:aminoglycoside phosphotransferase (APT) family kinase protein
MTEAARSEVKRSSRDPSELATKLESWLATTLPSDAHPSVGGIEGTSATGMSSETLLFDASWTEQGKQTRQRLVARLAPDAHDCPVFPSYDMERQAHVIALAGELTDVPVPRILGANNDPSVIGAPFFVMEAVDGIVPPDVMPYTFGDNWLFDAPPEDQERLAESTLDVLASLHGIDDAPERFTFLDFDDRVDTALRKHVAHTRQWYEFACKDTAPSKLTERAFDWLDTHWPSEESETVLSWGDARIGNVLYRDFRPVAVLDWEMAGLGPRELDLAWLVFAHRVFEHLAGNFGVGGMPHFLRPDDVVASYERKTGHAARDLDFYMVYAGVQWCIVFLRTGFRSVHFGEREMPADPDEFMHHRGLLEELIS